MPQECTGAGGSVDDPDDPWDGEAPDDQYFIDNETDDFLLAESSSPAPDSTWGPFAGCNTVSGAADPCDDGWHPAVDSRNNSLNQAIFAFAYGTVAYIGLIGGFGQYLVIEHNVYGVKYYSVYAHLNEVLVEAGQVVTSTTQVAKMGGTSGSVNGELYSGVGVHLHFEVRKAANVNSGYGVSGMVWWPRSRAELDRNFVNLSTLPYIRISNEYNRMP